MTINTQKIEVALKELIKEGIIEESYLPLFVSYSKDVGVTTNSIPYVTNMVKEMAHGHLFKNIESSLFKTGRRDEAFLYSDEFRQLVVREMNSTNIPHRTIMKDLAELVQWKGGNNPVLIDDILYVEYFIINQRLEKLGKEQDDRLINDIMVYLHKEVKVEVTSYDYSIVFWEFYYNLISEYLSDLYELLFIDQDFMEKIEEKFLNTYEDIFSPNYIRKNKRLLNYMVETAKKVDEYLTRTESNEGTAPLNNYEYDELKKYEKEILMNYDDLEEESFFMNIFKNSKAPYILDYTSTYDYLKACIQVESSYQTHVDKMRVIKSKYELNELKLKGNIAEIIKEYYLEDLKLLISKLDNMPINKNNHLKSSETIEKFGKDDGEYNSLILAEHRMMNIDKIYPSTMINKRENITRLNKTYMERIKGKESNNRRKVPTYDEVVLKRLARVEQVFKLPDNLEYTKHTGIVKIELSKGVSVTMLIKADNNKPIILNLSPTYLTAYSGSDVIKSVSSYTTDDSKVFSVSGLSKSIAEVLKPIELAIDKKNLINKMIITGYNLQYKNLKIK